MSRSSCPGLYVHVPFCRTKCPYCSFFSVTSLSLIPEWLEAIRKEVSLYTDKFGVFDSLYLGGGTPSLLSGRQLTELLASLRRYFSFSPNTEITIEANPDDIDSESLAVFSDLGINRISIGVQSFNEAELRYLRRRHSIHQTLKALECIRSSGFNNLGLDLMYGLPGQTQAEWSKSLESALEYKPEHISCYQLTFDESTPLGKMKAEGRMNSPEEQAERDFFLLTSSFLEKNGYIHYEISNFARDPANFSRHNYKYWSHVPYLGLGPSAHSFLDGVRWWNVRSVEQYSHALANKNNPIEGHETLSPEQLNLESLFLGLRTKDGIDLELIPKNPTLDAILADLQKSRFIRIRDGRLMPTRKGFLIADSLPLMLSD